MTVPEIRSGQNHGRKKKKNECGLNHIASPMGIANKKFLGDRFRNRIQLRISRSLLESNGSPVNQMYNVTNKKFKVIVISNVILYRPKKSSLNKFNTNFNKRTQFTTPLEILLKG